MSDGEVFYDSKVGEAQIETWEDTLKGLIQAGRPDDEVLTGSAAATHVQPVLDGYYTKLNEMFDDNNELGELIRSVMVGHQKNVQLADENGVSAMEEG